jgi:hypothetical protein
MPEKKTKKRAQKATRRGNAGSTQAGEYVREEIHHVRGGKHGARSAKQAIAIGLSKARRAGVKVGKPKKGTTSASTRKKAARDTERGQSRKPTASKTRSRATSRALKREGRSAASRKSLSRQARGAAARRGAADRSRAAKKAARTRKAKRAKRG